MELNENQKKELERLMNQKFELDELVPDDKIDYSDAPALTDEELKELINPLKAMKALLTKDNLEFLLKMGDIQIGLNQILDLYRQTYQTFKKIELDKKVV